MEMTAMNTDYDVRCLMCGTEVGRILDGRFRVHAGCSRPLVRAGRQLRCCECGGSLYLEALAGYLAPRGLGERAG